MVPPTVVCCASATIGTISMIISASCFIVVIIEDYTAQRYKKNDKMQRILEILSNFAADL
jgi:hypothetical protein